MDREFLDQLDQQALLIKGGKLAKDTWGNRVSSPPVVLEHVHFTEITEAMGTGGTKGAAIDGLDDDSSSALLVIDYNIPVEVRPGDFITDPSTGDEYMVDRVKLYSDPETHLPHHYEAEISEKE